MIPAIRLTEEMIPKEPRRPLPKQLEIKFDDYFSPDLRDVLSKKTDKFCLGETEIQETVESIQKDTNE